MVRPQPGQEVTCGMKLRMERDWRICWAQRTSSLRSPPGVGVRETRMVSPMPARRSGERPAVEATTPFMPIPASVRPRCRARSVRLASSV